MSALLLDANVLVRFLVQDDLKHGAAATSLFEKAERREIVLHLDVLAIAEAVYVLTGVYGRTRGEVANALLAVIENGGVETAECDQVADALRRFGTVPVDFPDAWLAARSAQEDRPVASFDRDFDKFKDVKRVDPATATRQ